jgi:hypothetical protein
MRDPQYRVNLRRISAKNLRVVRQLTRGLRRADAADDIPDLPDKIDMIYRVAFATAGAAELAKTRTWVEAKFADDHWRRPMMESLIYGGDFEAFRDVAA